MKNFLYSLFIGLFGIAGLTSIAFLWMYAAQSIQQAHLYSDIAAVRTQDTQPEIALQSSLATPWQVVIWYTKRQLVRGEPLRPLFLQWT